MKFPFGDFGSGLVVKFGEYTYKSAVLDGAKR
jgi:hypothetical protein